MEAKDKKCYQCSENKPKSEFAKNKRNKDGLQSDCRNCAKEYRILNKETMQEYQRNWYKRKRLLERI